MEENGAASAVMRTYSSDQWHAIEGACGPLYVPTMDDKGLKLRVQCTPARCACPSLLQALAGSALTTYACFAAQVWHALLRDVAAHVPVL